MSLLRRVGLALFAPVLAVVVALIISSIVMAALQVNPLKVFEVMLDFGDTPTQQVTQIVVVINRAIPLFLAGLAVAIAFLVLFGLGWGFFDSNNMPILCQITRPELRATGYGLMNLVSISCGGFADYGFGVMRDQQIPLFGIFSIFAGAALVSVALVLLIRPSATLHP